MNISHYYGMHQQVGRETNSLGPPRLEAFLPLCVALFTPDLRHLSVCRVMKCVL